MKRSQLDFRIKEFLTAPETDAELVRTYIADLRTENDRLIKKSNIDAALVILLSLVFLLISTRDVAELAIFGVKITRPGALSLAIPPIIAGLLVRIMSIAHAHMVTQAVYLEINKQAFPTLSKTQLDSLVIRTDIPFIDEPSDLWAGSRAWQISSILSGFSGVASLALLPLAFFIYSYYILFRQFHVQSTLVWISLILSLSLLGLAIAYVATDTWEAE
jgi:hypothetical protein